MWNVPNVLTMSRMVMVPIFIGEYMCGHPVWALFVFVLASLTDMLDGYLARKYNLITSFGKLFDPLADKLMVISALVCHALRGVIPWAAIVIVAVKELIMIAGGAYMFRKGIVVHSNIWGKSATVLFSLAMILGFFHDWFVRSGYPVDSIFLWISVAMTLCALTSYVIEAKRKLLPPGRKRTKPED